MQIANVIVATDLSETAGAAGRWGASLAALYGARLISAHVVELSLPNWLRGRYNIEEDDEARREVEARVEQWSVAHLGRPADVHLVEVGDGTRHLAGIAQRHADPALVITRSGADALQKFFVGSTAQSVVSEAPCPVFVVDPERLDPERHGDVVVATDLTTVCDPAIGAAADYARRRNRPLHIVRTSGVGHLKDKVNYLGEVTIDELKQRAGEAFTKVLERHAAVLKGLTHHAHIIEDKPVRGLSRLIDKLDASALFIGHMERDSKVENLFGRVSVRLMQQIQATMVVVPGALAASP